LARAGVPGIFFAEDHLQLGRLLHSPQRRMRLEWRIAQVEGIYGNDEHIPSCYAAMLLSCLDKLPVIRLHKRPLSFVFVETRNKIRYFPHGCQAPSETNSLSQQQQQM
jgi:hypothetical protein